MQMAISHIWRILWQTNMAMENPPFMDDFPISMTIYLGFSVAMFRL
jgi:hypothetical protein